MSCAESLGGQTGECHSRAGGPIVIPAVADDPPTDRPAEVRAGHSVEAITRFARESGADLIVLATLGRTGLRRVLIGRVAARVVRHAPCPVLVVRGMKR